jgi:hypothetical protein
VRIADNGRSRMSRSFGGRSQQVSDPAQHTGG